MRRIVTAREQAEMLAPWRTADAAAQNRARMIMDRRWKEQTTTPSDLIKQHIKNIKGDPQAQAEWASRPQKGKDDTIETGPEQLSQDTLPGMEKIRGTETRLQRGLQIDTSHPDFRRVWQMTFGQGQPVKDPGLFPDADLRYEDRGGRFDHPGLADAILDGMHASGGVGQHHSTDYDTATSYGEGYGPAQASSHQEWRSEQNLPVYLDSDWNGRGEDYGRAGSGNYADEHEIMLNRGAPLKLRDLQVPVDADEDMPFEWHSVLDGRSRDITAAYWGF